MSYWLIIRLWTYLADLNEQAQECLSLIVEQMKKITPDGRDIEDRFKDPNGSLKLVLDCFKDSRFTLKELKAMEPQQVEERIYPPANLQSGKLSFQNVKLAIKSQTYNKPTIKNILKVYEEIETNQVFGAPEIERVLKCSPSTAKNVMKKLREIGVVEEVKGKGKGKYTFISDFNYVKKVNEVSTNH